METRSPQILIEVFGKTDVGLVREHNEDKFLVADVSREQAVDSLEAPLQITLGNKGALFLVCDGMGGAAAGEVAAGMAVQAIYDTLGEGDAAPQRDAFARRLKRAIETANDRIFAQSRHNQSERGMGTTCTAAALVDRHLVVGQIGDSRCYVLRQGQFTQVTKDQSLAWQLIEAGAMTPEEAKLFEHANIILQALGVQDNVEVILSQVELCWGDVVLICSDGLHGPVEDEEIAEILRTEPDLKQAGELLIQKALEREGPDNVTLVLARFSGEDLPAPTAKDTVAFQPYDPGPDRERSPKPVSTKEAVTAPCDSKVTVEQKIPSELLAMGPLTSHHPDETPAWSWTARWMRSPVAAILVAAFLAAAAGTLFARCQQPGAAAPSSVQDMR